VALYSIGGGHNDMLMLLLTSWGVYAVLLRREGLGGALMTLASAIKLSGAVVLPFALLSDRRPNSSRRHAFLIGAGAMAIVVATISFVEFGGGILHLSGTLQSVQDQGGWQSVPGFLFSLVHVKVTSPVRVVFDVALAASVAWLLRRVWQGRMDWLDGAAWATFAVLVTAWTLLPWYVGWLLPLVALGSSRRLWTVSLAMTVVGAAMMVAGCFPNGL
jgi:hypothetical protein